MKHIITILVMLGAVLVAGCTDTADLESECVQAGGEWLSEHNECEAASADAAIESFCTEHGGSYNECASPCRHSEDQICIQSCVQVCSF